MGENSATMRSGGLVRHQAFCSFCSLPQKIYSKKHVNFFELAMFGVVGIIGTHLIWGEFHIAGPLVFLVITLLSETIHQMRWRHSIKCKHCGFDPLLYRKAPEEAALTVKTFLENRRQDPLYLLKPQPRIKPIVKKVKDYKPAPRSTDLQI